VKTNMQKLRGKIVEAGITQEALADMLGVDRSTFYRKVKTEGVTFTIAEVHKIVEVIQLSQQDAIEIFLSNKSH